MTEAAAVPAAGVAEADEDSVGLPQPARNKRAAGNSVERTGMGRCLIRWERREEFRP
jgi:hypothetical protein